MSERQGGPYDSVARKWLALAERRQAHFIELRDSGRWRRYFTETQLYNEMYRAMLVRDQWAQIVGLPLQQNEIDNGQEQLGAVEQNRPQHDGLQRNQWMD